MYSLDYTHSIHKSSLAEDLQVSRPSISLSIVLHKLRLIVVHQAQMLSLARVVAPEVRLRSLWGTLDIRSLPSTWIGWLAHNSLGDVDKKVAFSANFKRIVVSLSSIEPTFNFESRLWLQVLVVSLLFALRLIFYLCKVELFSFTDFFLTFLVLHQLSLEY